MNAKDLDGYNKLKCDHVMNNGKQCGMYKNSGVDYCWVHRTDLTDEERVARKRKKLEPPDVSTHEALLSYAAVQMHRLETGEVDHQFANAMKDYLNLCVRLLEKTEANRDTGGAALLAAALQEDEPPN